MIRSVYRIFNNIFQSPVHCDHRRNIPFRYFSVNSTNFCPKMATIIRKIISTKAAPRPVAPYNQALLVDRTLYVSGVLGMDKDSMKLVEGGAACEARQALANLGHILQAGDSSYERVVKTTVLLADLADFAAVNEVYGQVFTHDHPARSSFQVGALPLGAKVEIEVIAVSGDVRTIPSC